MAGVLVTLASACSGIGPPDRPRNLEATALNQHEITLTWTCRDEEYYGTWWTSSEDPAVSYHVYRDGSQVADVGDPEYTDGGLFPETAYCYRVTSFWDEDLFDWLFVQESDRSAEACAWTYPLNVLAGSVLREGGQGLEGVLVELILGIGFPSVIGTTRTGPEGAFSFSALENSGYIVVPSLEGYVFDPEERSLNLVNEDAVGADFTAFPEP